MSNQGSIFISYRRSDSQDFTRKLYDRIAPRFEGDMVFRDLDSIDGGLPWKGFIEEQLANCRVLVAVIGSTWLNAVWNGQRRLDNPNDWVRREIEHAFINGIPIIPVLINGTLIPKAAELPGPLLKRLPMLQARRIRYESEIDQAHIDWLIQDINKHLKKPDPRKGYQEDIEGCVLEMIRIPKGTFLMGAGKDEVDAENMEKPRHKVNVPAFWLGKYPITQQQWYAVSLLPDIDIHLNPYPSNFEGYNLPVEQVSWYEAVEFCNRLTEYSSQKDAAYPNMQYRLPSEIEWEYACRAGTKTPFHYGQEILKTTRKFLLAIRESRLANCKSSKTSSVGSHQPNAFDLYDMHGNVFEWCQDHWHENYDGAPTDGSAWITGGDSRYRVMRGGSWFSYPHLCRSAFRGHGSPDCQIYDFGFRVACSALSSLQ